MRMIRDILVIISALALIIYVSDKMAEKYNTDDTQLTCLDDDVQNLLLDVTTKDLIKSVNEQGYILNSSILKENTVTKERKQTIGNKAILTCSTSIKLSLKADPNYSSNVDFIKSVANENGDTFVTSFDKDYTVQENDMGTYYWVHAKEVYEFELKNRLD